MSILIKGALLRGEITDILIEGKYIREVGPSLAVTADSCLDGTGKAVIPGFVNIPLLELRARMGELDPNKPVYLCCQSGLRSYAACRFLMGHGFTCYNLAGGYHLYESVTNAKKGNNPQSLA